MAECNASDASSSWSLSRWEDMELQYPDSDEMPLPAVTVGGAQAVITAVEEARSAQVELYDSGATRHPFPYCEDFMLPEKCVCGGQLAAVKMPAAMPLPLLPPPRPSSSTSSPSPSSPVLAAPSSENADGMACATSAHSVAPTTVSSSPTEKPRDLRRERPGEEEVTDGEICETVTALTRKRRKLMPNSILLSSTPATPAPVPEIVSTPEITKAQEVGEAIVPNARNLALYPQHRQHAPQSAPAPESEQEQSEDPSAAATDATSAPHKIGIQHLQLAYVVVGMTLQCRMCL
jgi:hypothetical protein